MGDYRKFLRILENQEPGGAVMFEYRFPEELAEQLIWRRGRHLWENEAARVRTTIAAAHLSGLDCAAVEFSDQLTGLDGLEQELPEGMKIAAGLEQGLAERVAAGVPLSDAVTIMKDGILKLAKNNFVCAVLISDNFDNVHNHQYNDIFEHYRHLVSWIYILHNIHIYCIFVDRSTHPIPLKTAVSLGFHALYLNPYYPQTTAEILSEFGEKIAILGDTAFPFTSTAKPQDIIDYVTGLQALSKNKGFAFGSGNILGSPMPYLNFVSILTVLLREK